MRTNTVGLKILGLKILTCAAMFLAVLSPGCRSDEPEEAKADNSEPNVVVAEPNAVVAAPVAEVIVVTVNGVEIAMSAVEQLIRPKLDSLADKTKYLPAHFVEQSTQQFRKQALEQLIRQELLDAVVRQANITITDEKVTSQLEEIAANQGVSLDDFIKTVERHGRSIDQIKQDLRERLARNQFMEAQWAGKVSVTEDDARKYYDENSGQFKVPEQVRVSHILIRFEEGADPNEANAKARAVIEGLLKQVKDGADFAELAKANSVCPSAPEGGDLDFFPRGKTTPAFEKVAFELKVGQISDIVETEYGFHIIKATDHRDPSDITFEQARETIIEQLTTDKQSNFADEYLKKLKTEAKIVYPTGI